jgi:hypothetical protein
MRRAVQNLVAQGLVCTLGQFIIDDGIGGHLDASVIAGPVLSLGKQLAASRSGASVSTTDTAKRTPPVR